MSGEMWYLDSSATVKFAVVERESGLADYRELAHLPPAERLATTR